MRTRFLQKMTHAEVSAYAEKNDLVFVPFGTVEVHGNFPLNVETKVPEAFAELMAEETDGLILGDLPYFFPGASPMSPGTVQMSVEAGYAYLKKIAYSLLNQGFRRQVYLSFHGPAFLTAGALVVDFFDETKVPISYIDLTVAAEYVMKHTGLKIDDSDLLMFGAYDILGIKNELVVDPGIAQTPKEGSDTSIDRWDYMRRYAHPSGSVGFYFAKPEDHAGMTGSFKSIEERDEKCAEGGRIMREIVSSMDMKGYVNALHEIDDETVELMKKYGTVLPKSTYDYGPRKK